jgi:hypothetical protein
LAVRSVASVAVAALDPVRRLYPKYPPPIKAAIMIIAITIWMALFENRFDFFVVIYASVTD